MSEKINIEPLGNRVLVRPIEQEAKTSSGILLPETAKEKPQMGEVMAVGDDEEMPVKVGQKVLFPKYTGTEIKLDGVEYIIMDATDLLAVVKDK
ncbi:MAG: co-chaperone GroES [Anaerolineae bacterium]|nr:MAG: co-chaperone GroES [Anaerolineae bacterium]